MFKPISCAIVYMIYSVLIEHNMLYKYRIVDSKDQELLLSIRFWHSKDRMQKPQFYIFFYI